MRHNINLYYLLNNTLLSNIKYHEQFHENIHYTVKWYLTNQNWLKYRFKKFSGQRIGIIK